MLRSFKNLELLRYHVSNSIEKNIRQFTDKSEQDSLQLASSVFSTTFSLIATFVSTKYMEDIHTYGNIQLILLIFVIGFAVAYITYVLLFKLIKKLKLSYKKYKIKNNDTIKQLIDDFDNIACDNVLIAKEFIKHYKGENRKDDKKAATFAYYEALYYLKSASERVEKVLSDELNCINDANTVTRLSLYRVVNISSIMKDIFKFIEDERKNILIEDAQPEEIDHQIEYLKKNLDTIQSQIAKKQSTSYLNIKNNDA